METYCYDHYSMLPKHYPYVHRHTTLIWIILHKSLMLKLVKPNSLRDNPGLEFPVCQMSVMHVLENVCASELYQTLSKAAKIYCCKSFYSKDSVMPNLGNVRLFQHSGTQ